MVRHIGVENMIRLVNAAGLRPFLAQLADHIEDDFRRWAELERTPRIASHSSVGVIELMPTSDGRSYGHKHVNGHPTNTRTGLPTVTAFGLLVAPATSRKAA